jgi:hypothetical protein
MAPVLLPNFKFRLFFMGFGSSISVPSPIPTSNVYQCVSTVGSSSPSSDPTKHGSSNTIEPLIKKPNKSYDKPRVFQDTWATFI